MLSEESDITWIEWIIDSTKIALLISTKKKISRQGDIFVSIKEIKPYNVLNTK